MTRGVHRDVRPFPTEETAALIERTLEFSEVAAWGLIVAPASTPPGLASPPAAPVALAGARRTGAKAMLLPLT